MPKRRAPSRSGTCPTDRPPRARFGPPRKSRVRHVINDPRALFPIRSQIYAPAWHRVAGRGVRTYDGSVEFFCSSRFGGIPRRCVFVRPRREKRRLGATWHTNSRTFAVSHPRAIWRADFSLSRFPFNDVTHASKRHSSARSHLPPHTQPPTEQWPLSAL